VWWESPAVEQAAGKVMPSIISTERTQPAHFVG
jgi:hypothetical protein